MDWEAVKGFCRRQTQAAKEKVNNAPHTIDPEFNVVLEDYVKLRNTAHTTEQKLTLLQNHLNAANEIINDLGSTLGQGHKNEEIMTFARKMEIFRNESNSRMARLSGTFTTCINELKKFGQEAQQLEQLVEDRRDKVLEYDFFKNKLEELRTNPPTDTSRIPRNEGRMLTWKAKYDDITNRMSSFMTNSRVGGESALLHSAVAVCNEYGRYLEEVSRAARAVLIVDNNNAFSAAVRQVVQLSTAASAMAPQVQQQIQQQYQNVQNVPQQQQYQQSPPPEQQQDATAPSRRNKRDDPFAL